VPRIASGSWCDWSLAPRACLDRVEQIPVEDGWLLAGGDLALEREFADVEPVAEQVGEGTAGKGNAADDLTGLQDAPFGDDASLSQVSHQQVEAAEVEVALEDGPDSLGLFLIDRDLPVLAVVAEGDQPADS
jgi:hypothetical protein